MHTCHYWFIHLHWKPNRMLTFEAVWIFYPLSDQSFFFLSSLFWFPWLVQTHPSLFTVLREKAVPRGCSLVILPLPPPLSSLLPSPSQGLRRCLGRCEGVSWLQISAQKEQLDSGVGVSCLCTLAALSLQYRLHYRGTWFMTLRYGSLPYTLFSDQFRLVVWVLKGYFSRMYWS